MIKILKDLVEERRKNKDLEKMKKMQLADEFLIEQGIICKDCGVIIGYSFVAEEKYCVTCQRDKNIDDILN